MKFLLLSFTFCCCAVHGFSRKQTVGSLIKGKAVSGDDTRLSEIKMGWRALKSALKQDRQDERDPVIFNKFSITDLFLTTATNAFSSFHYRARGYDSRRSRVYINGILMNDPATGMAYRQQWAGLYDVFQNRSSVLGIGVVTDGFGGLSETNSINATAAAQHHQTEVFYGLSNRSYRNQLTVSYSTGLMKNGWAVSALFARRWSKEGYLPACFYDGYSYYFALSKKISTAGMLHFTALGTHIEQGMPAAATLEAMDLAGSHYYNPNWGYSGGEKRNAAVNSFSRPVFILNYEYKPNPLTRLNIAASYQTGYDGNSALDWYNARDPRPDYYRNLPGYYLYNPLGADSAAAEAVRQEWLNNPGMAQVDWDHLYAVNQLNYKTINGASGRRSLYVLGQNRNDVRQYNFAVDLQKGWGNHIMVYTGIALLKQKAERYKKMLDLLGGDYYVNLNPFAEHTYVGHPEFIQNDLNHPNEIIKKGDKYGYDYIADFLKACWWGQAKFYYDKVDFFAAARIGISAFRRTGLYKNGLFQEDSYGKSKLEQFTTYQLKGGFAYTVAEGHSLFINGTYGTEAPLFENTFYAPQIRNATLPDPVPEKIMAVEGGYLFHTPHINGRMTVFAANIDDAANILRFYHESYRTFVNYAMRGISVRHLGAELALKVKLSHSFSLTAVAGWMQVFYTSRPDIAIYRNNDTTNQVIKDTVYWKNYFAASGPQSAYALGLHYYSSKHWQVRMRFNYLDRAFMKVNPARLTRQAVDLIAPGSAQWHAIVDQQQLPPAFTIDLFAGKEFSLNKLMKWLPDPASLRINIGLRNILNNKNILNTGFQQLRFDYNSRNPAQFPPKYTYAYGINYVLNIRLKF